MNNAVLDRPESGPGQVKTIRCTVCGADSRLDFVHPQADIYRCERCGHCFSDVNSIREHEAYGNPYHDQEHKNWLENPNLRLFDWMERQIRQSGDQASVLDIGCGRAQFLGYLATRNPKLQLTGVELDRFSPPCGVRLLTGDFLQLDIPERFDFVVSQAVIEHVADVRAFVDRAVQLCKPGGRLIIMTLNEQSVLYYAARCLRRLGFGGPFEQLYSRHHLNHFTKRSLQYLLTEHGVSVLQRYDHHIPVAAIDFPQRNRLSDALRKLGAEICFAAGELTRQCYLQTIVGQVR